MAWFALVAGHPIAYLEQQEHYVKSSYRNRCHIASVNGAQRLTLPLRKGKNQQQSIRDVRLAYDEPWPSRHWAAIRTAYGSAPFYEHYAHLFEPLYRTKRYEWLWDWNAELLGIALHCLKMQPEMRLTNEYEPQPLDKLDARHWIHPKRSPEAVGIHLAHYPQVFEDRLGFLENLSVLDLIFCAGPAAPAILLATTLDR